METTYKEIENWLSINQPTIKFQLFECNDCPCKYRIMLDFQNGLSYAFGIDSYEDFVSKMSK